MSQETTKHTDQAEHLKKLFDEVQQNEAKKEKEPNGAILAEKQGQDVKIDVLNLPPRKEVHGTSADRARFKLGKPFLRFLTVTIILVILMIAAYFIWTEELINIIKNLQ